jgi:hypothetical protein
MYKFRGNIIYELDDITRYFNSACELILQVSEFLLSKTDWQEFLQRDCAGEDLPILVKRPTDEELLKLTVDLQMATDSLAILAASLYAHHLIPHPDSGHYKDGCRIDPAVLKSPSSRTKTRRAATRH